MDFDTAKTELNTLLGDANNVTFTDAEKTRALTKAWNDPYAVKVSWDSSLTYTQGTYQYDLPETLTTVKDMYLSTVGDDNPFPEPISNDLWDLVDGKIQFNLMADSLIPAGSTLYLKGNYKFTTDDPLNPVGLQEYVLSLAGYNTLTMLSHKKANLFVKNDITMGELLSLRQQLMVDIKEARTRLLKEYESA